MLVKKVEYSSVSCPKCDELTFEIEVHKEPSKASTIIVCNACGWRNDAFEKYSQDLKEQVLLEAAPLILAEEKELDELMMSFGCWRLPEHS